MKEFEIFVGKHLIYENKEGEKFRVIVTRSYDRSFRFTAEGTHEEVMALLDEDGKWISNGKFTEYIKK
jgi:hypothetical protein